MASTTKTGACGVAPAAGAATSAPDTPPAAQPSPSAASPPRGPAAAVLAALVAGPGASAAQLAQAAGITRTAAARELAALEKAGHASRDRDASPATWTARDVPDEAPGPDSTDSLAQPHRSSIGAAGTATQDTELQGTGDLDPEKNAGSVGRVGPAGIAPGAGEALGSATAAAAQAEAALQAGDLAGARSPQPITSRRQRRGYGGCCETPAVPPAAHLAAYPAEDFGPPAIGRVLGGHPARWPTHWTG